VFAGLGLLISHILVTSSVKIKTANEAGIKKMQRNILALQQNLKTILIGAGNRSSVAESFLSQSLSQSQGPGSARGAEIGGEVSGGGLSMSLERAKKYWSLFSLTPGVRLFPSGVVNNGSKMPVTFSNLWLRSNKRWSTHLGSTKQWQGSYVTAIRKTYPLTEEIRSSRFSLQN
jgi:hypothetical protein